MIYSLSFSRKLDYIPFVACLKNFFEIFEKYVLKKAPFKESHSLIHLQEKTFLERVILLIPFFGNIFIYKHRKKTLIEFLADCANQKSIPIGVSFSKEEITSEPVKKHLLDSMDSFKTKDAKKIVASMIMAYDNQDDLIEAIKVKNPWLFFDLAEQGYDILNIKEFLDSKSFLDHHSIGILKTELGKQEGKIKHNNHEIDISSLKELPTEIIYSFIINKSLDAKTIYKLKRTLSQDIRRALLNMALKHCRYKILDAWLTKKSLFFLRVDPLYHDLKQALNYDFKDIDVISAQKIAEVSTELLDLAIHNAFTFKNKGMILQFLNKHPISIPLEIFAAFLRNANKIIEDSKTESLKFFIEALLDDKISLCGSARFMAFAPILLQEAFEKNKYIVSFIIKISGTNISKQLLNTFAHTAAEEIKKDGPNRKYCEAIFYEISQITSSDGKSPYLTMIHEICKEYHITLDGLHGFDDLEDPTTLDLR